MVSNIGSHATDSSTHGCADGANANADASAHTGAYIRPDTTTHATADGRPDTGTDAPHNRIQTDIGVRQPRHI